ncbi:MAG: N-acetylmuramic acid 6-phosphate etherase [Actinomycetota bacterium]
MGRAGTSYFGVRIPRHVERDMHDLAALGYGGVTHTLTENDLAYYRETMREIVAGSHRAGLWVQASPWGLGRTFGGEAESRFVAFHPEECQVMDDGRRVAAACLNSPAYRAFCAEWADWALDSGVDSLFWDEPAWVVPAHVGVEAERFGCFCDHCRERFGRELPRELEGDLLAFRQASVIDFLRELLARGGNHTICLLPSTEGAHGIGDWDAVASLPGLSTFATDPYWKHWNEDAEPFVRRFARLLRETCDRHGVAAQLWLPSFGMTADDIPELEAAVRATREERVDDVWTWGYEACGHMSALATPDSPQVWVAITTALTEQPLLEERSARDLVREMNRLDATVADAVAAAGDELALAIDAVAARLEAGGRLVYVGAGTSIALAAIDAMECPPTFGTDDGAVIAIGAGACAAVEDDEARGAADLAAAGVGPADAVVAISASGTTPYTVAALETARAAGALTVGVVCVPGSRIAELADHAVVAEVGPEIVSGSTRLKAGTAQKLIVNTISTATNIRLGRTFDGLMVSVVPDNAKLRERARRNVVLASGAPEAAVDDAFAAAGGDARVALVTLLAGIDADAARLRLEESHGSVKGALR